MDVENKSRISSAMKAAALVKRLEIACKKNKYVQEHAANVEVCLQRGDKYFESRSLRFNLECLVLEIEDLHFARGVTGSR